MDFESSLLSAVEMEKIVLWPLTGILPGNRGADPVGLGAGWEEASSLVHAALRFSFSPITAP